MKILVLGIGNILFADEGIGVHITNLLERKYDFDTQEHELVFMDGGTLAQHLIPHVVEHDFVIMVDCVDADDANVEDVFFFDFAHVPESVTWQGSAHEVEMLQTLTMMDMEGDLPPTKVVGVVPANIDTTFDLSDAIKRAAPLMERVILNFLEKEFGITHTCKHENLDVQYVSYNHFRREPDEFTV